jgi:hypothetical protein
MYFNYKNYIEELKISNQESEKKVYAAWLNSNGKTDYKQEKFYKYLSEIEPIKYRVPEEYEYDFNFDLLLQLVATSIASSYDFVFPDLSNIDENENIDITLPDLVIHVESDSQKFSKSIYELELIQIERLFKIFFGQMILLWDVRRGSKVEKSIIQIQLAEKINEYNQRLIFVNRYLERINCIL